MNITSKSRYALKIMMDLASHGEHGLVQRADIARRQGIPSDYMDQILARLREGGLIASERGRAGGYRMAIPANQLSVLHIFQAVEDAFEPVQCLDTGRGCTVEHVCGARDAWAEISQAIHLGLSGIILSDLAARGAYQDKASGDKVLQECRAPTRRNAMSQEQETL